MSSPSARSAREIIGTAGRDAALSEINTYGTSYEYGVSSVAGAAREGLACKVRRAFW
jgi:hypothetical protein